MTDPLQNVPFDPEHLLQQYDSQGLLENYVRLLGDENKKLNLVSRETSPSDLRLLTAESLLPLEFLKQSRFDRYLDIGSGGGLPAIPLVLTGQIEHAVLLERTEKKCLALQRIIRALELDTARVEAIQADFDRYQSSHTFDLITLRLVRLTPKLAKKINGLLAPGGVTIYFSSLPANLPGIFSSFAVYRYLRETGRAPKAFTIFQK